MLDDLYREVIMDHYKRPRNRGGLDEADVVVEGVNPLCGDQIKLWLDIDGDRIIDARFEGHGCSISQASVSMMTEAIKGRPISDVNTIVEDFRGMMLGGAAADGDKLGELVALEGVKQFPVRIKCAVLGWNTLQLGLTERDKAPGGHVELKHSEA